MSAQRKGGIEIGRYRLDILNAGDFWLDGGAMFGIVPKTMWSRRITADEKNRIPMTARCLLLRDEHHCILIDAGAGDKEDARFADRYGISFPQGRLEEQLMRLGVSAEDVTHIMLTHLHFDHVGGCTKRCEDGSVSLVFQNAVHMVQREHWEWALSKPLREEASFLDENLLPILRSGRLQLLEGSETGLSEIASSVFYGHTKAMQGFWVGVPGNGFFYAADLIPTQHHLRPLWNMGYDIEPLRTPGEKEEVMSRAHHQGFDVVFEHDRDVIACGVDRGVNGWEWMAPKSVT